MTVPRGDPVLFDLTPLKAPDIVVTIRPAKMKEKCGMIEGHQIKEKMKRKI